MASFYTLAVRINANLPPITVFWQAVERGEHIGKYRHIAWLLDHLARSYTHIAWVPDAIERAETLMGHLRITSRIPTLTQGLYRENTWSAAEYDLPLFPDETRVYIRMGMGRFSIVAPTSQLQIRDVALRVAQSTGRDPSTFYLLHHGRIEGPIITQGFVEA